MQLTDPRELLAAVDQKRFHKICGDSELALLTEPTFATLDATSRPTAAGRVEDSSQSPPVIRGGIQRFGDAIDTDLVRRIDTRHR